MGSRTEPESSEDELSPNRMEVNRLRASRNYYHEKVQEFELVIEGYKAGLYVEAMENRRENNAVRPNFSGRSRRSDGD